MIRHMLLFTFCICLYCCIHSQRVEIHQLGLGDGDCSLIIVIDTVENIFIKAHLDTSVVLIDGQRKSRKAAEQMTIYIDSILGKELKRKKIDNVVVSHLHIDHYGNMKAVLENLLAKGYSIQWMFDRSAYIFPSLTCGLKEIDSCYGLIKGIPQESKSAREYLDYVKMITPLHYGSASVQPGDSIFHFTHFKYVGMQCLAANGAAINFTTGKPAIFLPPKADKYEPKSENDLSLAFLLSYQGFRYFTGGDIGGPGTGGGYVDGETPISTYLVSKYGNNFHVCAFKVSHHGSSESTDANFLNRMNPTLAVVPASLRTYGSSTNPLPTCTTLTNLNSHNGTTINYTFVPKGNKGTLANYCKYKNLDLLQDVVIKISKNPGYGTIDLNITRSQRDAATMELNGVVQNEVIQCTKVHVQ